MIRALEAWICLIHSLDLLPFVFPSVSYIKGIFIHPIITMDSTDSGTECPLFLGFDLSTQQLKAAAINEDLQIVHEATVQYDSDLPEFRTQGGVNEQPNKVVTAPPLMWIKALDMVMERLKINGLDFSRVKGIGGSGQQHGSVYWRKGSRNMLQSLKADQFLHLQLDGAFSLRESPIWMDSSTSKEVHDIEEMVGGPTELAQITGSKGYERFTGSQMLKIMKKKFDIYTTTERISLVSSFLCSLLLGDYAPIDSSDGSGMNLLDIWTQQWNQLCLSLFDNTIRDKLGDVVPSGSIVGKVSPYYVTRYGFSPSCDITAFTGDNPASLVGMGCLQEGDIAVSLGTSDTLFLTLKEPKSRLRGHILCHPMGQKDLYMGLVCFKNGSLTRERIRDECCEGEWTLFSELLESTPRGNFGNIGFYLDFVEIYPLVSGDFRFNKNRERISKFSKEVDVRAVVESQFFRLKLAATEMGFTFNSDSRLLATGGASVNPSILQVLSDIFNCRVFAQDQPNSALIGACLMARFNHLKEGEDVPGLMARASPFKEVAKPSNDSLSVYEPMIEKYQQLEETLVAISSKNC